MNFEPTIKSDIDAYSAARALGWSSYIQSSPMMNEWNIPPAVLICPTGREDIDFISFGCKRVVNNYNIFLVTINDGQNQYEPVHSQFVDACVGLFMPGYSLLAAGCYQNRVYNNYDFDRLLFPSNSLVTCMTVSCKYIFNDEVF